MKHNILLLMAVLLLCACGKNKEDQQGNELTLNGDIITVADNSPILKKLSTQTVETGTFRSVFSTSCEAKPLPSCYAEVANPCSGRITRSFVRLGQRVQAGAPLFEINAPDYNETIRAYLQAKGEMNQAQQNLNRVKSLNQNRVASQRDLEEATLDFQNKQQEYQSYRAALRAFQVNPDEVGVGAPLIVRAPIAGEVMKCDIVIGQYLKDDADPSVIIADVKKVWVVANVKEKDLPRLNNIEEVGISLIALPDDTIKGKICNISELLDPETRSVEVMIECDNADRRIKPGMYGTVMLTGAEKTAIRIPTAAILQEEESSYVLVALDRTHFRRAAVQCAEEHDGFTIIESGLNAGDEIVVSGAFYMLSAR